MRYLVFGEEQQSYPICLLVTRISRDEIKDAYITPFGINEQEVMVLDLHQSETSKKTPAKEQKQYIEEELAPVLTRLGVEYIVVTDSDYFKTLTKAPKVEVNLGYVLPCVFGPWKVVYAPNYRQIFFDPDKIKAKIALGLEAVLKDRQGDYQTPGTSIIHFAAYPQSPEEIEEWLERLVVENRPLTCDIETFSLKHHSSGIGTITFCWSQHEGIAFPVDYAPIAGATEAPFGIQTLNVRVRKALLSFFQRFNNKITYHGVTFDAYILIYQLFMKDLLDTEGLLTGLEVMLKNWDCTKLITYLATNSCAGNVLRLKAQAQEFAGNYAVDEIEDITRVPLPKLLEYNLVDGLSTWFVREKHWQTMVDDEQLDLYEGLFKDTTVDIIQMQLTGMPVNIETAKKVNVQLAEELAAARAQIMGSPIIAEYTQRLNERWVSERNAVLKKKRVTLADAKEEFNPNSDPQMRELLFDMLGLPVINLTKSKLPSTDGESIEALLNRATEPRVLELLQAFQLYAIINTLTTNFMPAILGSVQASDGWHYLFGNFNLGGTLSGRLSSSDPNLQNLPSTGKGHKLKLKYAKLIKSCFEAPPGWLFVGIDFSSLEDRISALTTKDPNKLKVYTDGYDGHSLRAYAYWPDKMPDIDPNSVESINSIGKKYKPLRDRSKNPTFTLTYQGTKHALMKKYGFSEAEADEIVERYQSLYQVSINWVNTQLQEASQKGYVTVAFGLRLRTPLLKQVIRGTSKTPYEAEAEGRTAGNALGQSWCLLNSRAWVEFMQKVRKHQDYRLQIRPCAQIHDAGYAIIKDDIDVVLYTNEHVVEAVCWQEDPLIAHDEVKLGGELSIFNPTWNDEITIPNHATREQIFAIVEAVSTS